MKILLSVLIPVLTTAFVFIYINQQKNNQRLKESLYMEEVLSRDNEILRQLILMKNYHYTDFESIDYDILLVRPPDIPPITINGLTFYFSCDSILREIKFGNVHADSILKKINEIHESNSKE
jgi:hypothetical protein